MRKDRTENKSLDSGLLRRDFMKSTGAALVAGAFAGTAIPAMAQSGPARTLLKGGVVLTFDRGLGDFDKADVLIEGRKIAAIRPNIQAEAQTIDASRMIVVPGFIDTHHHFYQSALRNVLANGLLADYFRDISGAATNHYRAEDAYTGNYIGALRSIDAGVTTITDISQVSNTPEHSDALIKALKDSGIRALYAYSRGSGTGAKFPQDVERIAKQHFSSRDQLVTLAMGTAVNKDQWLAARSVGARIFTHIVGGNPGRRPGRPDEARRRRADEGRQRLYPLHQRDRRADEARQGHRRVVVHRGADRDGDAPRHAADPAGAGRGHKAEPVERRRDHHGRRHVHPDAGGVHVATCVVERTRDQGREGPSAAAHREGRDRVRDAAGRAGRTGWTPRPARSPRARTPTSSCCAPTSPTRCRSTAPMAPS